MIAGPLPRMLTDAVAWVSRAMRTSIRFGDDGHGRNVHEYPLVAVRELIANALVHRDLSEPALSKGIEIRLLRDRPIIPDPGGLWGLSVDQLGTRDGKSAVNEYLYNVCTFATDGEGRRVIEGLGSGIREVRRALHDADMESVRFQDTGVRFTALLPRGALLSPGISSGSPGSTFAVSASPSATHSSKCGMGSRGRTRPTAAVSASTPSRPGVGSGNSSAGVMRRSRGGGEPPRTPSPLPSPDPMRPRRCPTRSRPRPRTPPPSAHRPVSVHPSNLTAAIRPPLDRVG